MILKNRVVATEGLKNKDGREQIYKFAQDLQFDDHAVTWGHPYNNDLAYADVIGKFLNPRIKDGKLIVDIAINEDKLDYDRWRYLYDHPDASIGYC